MNKKDFYYDLPKELIAQHPIEPRDHSRLLVADRISGEIKHRRFYDLPDFLNGNDCLILNDSRVLPARLFGEKETSGGVKRVEFLLLNPKGNDVWEVLLGPAKKAKINDIFSFGESLEAQILEALDNGNRLVRFMYQGNFYDVLDKVGQMPLPHYITEKLEDGERYQTV